MSFKQNGEEPKPKTIINKIKTFLKKAYDLVFKKFNN